LSQFEVVILGSIGTRAPNTRRTRTRAARVFVLGDGRTTPVHAIETRGSASLGSIVCSAIRTHPADTRRAYAGAPLVFVFRLGNAREAVARTRAVVTWRAQRFRSLTIELQGRSLRTRSAVARAESGGCRTIAALADIAVAYAQGVYIGARSFMSGHIAAVAIAAAEAIAAEIVCTFAAGTFAWRGTGLTVYLLTVTIKRALLGAATSRGRTGFHTQSRHRNCRPFLTRASIDTRSVAAGLQRRTFLQERCRGTQGRTQTMAAAVTEVVLGCRCRVTGVRGPAEKLSRAINGRLAIVPWILSEIHGEPARSDLQTATGRGGVDFRARAMGRHAPLLRRDAGLTAGAEAISVTERGRRADAGRVVTLDAQERVAAALRAVHGHAVIVRLGADDVIHGPRCVAADQAAVFKQILRRELVIIGRRPFTSAGAILIARA
jgi:hypothetical protein